MREWKYSSTILEFGWRWVVSFTPRPLYPGGTVLGTYLIGGWVGRTTDLNAVE
jgi:hypothetical protein